MSVTVCLSTNTTLNYPQGGGHLWVFLNWAFGLRALGCEVVWLETVSEGESAGALKSRRKYRRLGLEPDGLADGLAGRTDEPAHEVRANVATLKGRLERYGLAGRLALCSRGGEALSEEVTRGSLDLEAAAEADLLLNMRYDLPGEVVERFRRSALVDIDPGLLQIWISQGLIGVPRHDLYFTIGETLGRPGAPFPDLGLEWHYTPPPVYLPEWPPVPAGSMAPYTTVSHWWDGTGGSVEFQGELRHNEKRAAFLDYVRTSQHEPPRLWSWPCAWHPETKKTSGFSSGEAGASGMHGPSVPRPSSIAPISSDQQLLIFRTWPSFSPGGLVVTLLFVALAVAAALNYASLRQRGRHSVVRDRFYTHNTNPPAVRWRHGGGPRHAAATEQAQQHA